MWRNCIWVTSESGDFYRRNSFAIGCENVILEVQQNIISRSVLVTVTGLVGKVKRRPRNSWITQKIKNKMDKRRN
jgi:hypothetical protein